MANIATAETRPAHNGWTQNNAVILAVCVLGWVFDVYEQTVMQIVTPILIKEFGIAPSTMGSITTIGRWVGLIGIFVFPALADLYGRKPILIIAILGYSLFSGLTGFATGWVSLLLLTSLNRVALSGELPVGMVMVTETAPTKWRATALSILNGGFPLGYMLCSLAAYFVVPMWGWRTLYFLGVVPALLVLWIRFGVKESPRFEHVSATMVRDGLKKRLDIWAPVRKYPRDMLIASLIYFFFLFTWIGWSAWMPQFLAVEKKLGFQLTVQYLSIWMFIAIFSYWVCGWLADVFGRRYLIPALAIPASSDPFDHRQLERSEQPVLGRPRCELPRFGQLRGRAWLHRRAVSDTNPRHCGRGRLHLRHRGRCDRANHPGSDRQFAFHFRRAAAARAIVLPAGAAVSVLRPRYHTSGIDGLRWRKEIERSLTDRLCGSHDHNVYKPL